METADLYDAAVIAAFEAAPVGVAISRDGITEFCNTVYLDMFGYRGHTEEIHGKSLLSMIAPEQRHIITQRVALRKEGEPVETSYDSIGLRRDGSTFPFHVAVHRLPTSAGPKTLAFFFDLTNQRLVEEDLRATNARLSALIAACPVPILMVDPTGLVKIWNPASERTFGWEASEVLGRQNPIVAPSDRAEFERNIVTGMTTGLGGVPARRRRRDGSTIDVELYAAPVKDVGGEPVGVMALAVDVTQRQQTEAALRASQEHLRHAQRLEALGRLAGGVAHDYNNLLMVVSGLVELLSTQVPPNAADTIGHVRTALERAAGLTRQLLAFGRRQVLNPTELNLNALLQPMKEMIEAMAGTAIPVTLSLEPALGRVRADPSQLELVVVNLAVNARDAMENGGRLEIKTSNADLGEELSTQRFPVPGGRYVCLSVTDTGPGIPSDTFNRLFEPFFTTKPKGKGTGLGLATVQGIVEQSGGHVHVSTGPRGSSFAVYLPRLAGGPLEVSAPAPRRTARRGVVVLVDDDPAVRSLVRALLEHAGHQVLEAQDGENALELLAASAAQSPVLLTDVMMPRPDGAELAERAWNSWPSLPVIFMTGYAAEQAFPERIRQRAAGLLAKPFTADTLHRAVEAALERTPRRAPEPG